MSPRAKKSSPTRRAPQRPDIAQEEWDFSGCPSDQIDFCRRYEFARHNEALKADIAKIRAKGDWSSGLAPYDWGFYSARAKLRFYRAFDEFPNVPWLKIPAAKRAKGCTECQLLEGPFLEVYPERIQLADEYPYFPNDAGLKNVHRVSVVEIDLTASKNAIKQSFVRWLDSIHRDSPLLKEQRGGVTDADLLKALGAYRLLQHFNGNYEMARDWSVAHGKNGKPLYVGQPEWIDARKKVEKVLGRGIPPNDVADLVSKLDWSKLDRRELALVKVFVMKNVGRAEARRLKKLGPERAMAELRAAALAHKTSA